MTVGPQKRNLLHAHFFELIHEGTVTDAQKPGGSAAVSSRLLQRCPDDFLLSSTLRFPHIEFVRSTHPLVRLNGAAPLNHVIDHPVFRNSLIPASTRG